MANERIRAAAKENCIRLWQIADCMGMWDTALSRKLRHELPEVEQQHILEVIDKLAKEAQA